MSNAPYRVEPSKQVLSMSVVKSEYPAPGYGPMGTPQARDLCDALNAAFAAGAASQAERVKKLEEALRYVLDPDPQDGPSASSDKRRAARALLTKGEA